MGTIYRRHRKLWLKYRDPDGKLVRKATEYAVGQEKDAERLLARVEKLVTCGHAEAALGETGPLTVARWAGRWIEQRKATVEGWAIDKQRIDDYVLPALGELSLIDVQPHHIRDLVLAMRQRSMRDGKPMAPRTLLSAYSAVRVMFSDAVADGLIPGTPCVLRKGVLPKLRDKDPLWRATAVFTREEIELLIASPSVLPDRRVVHALQALAGLRHGEVAALRWSHYDGDARPLPRLLVAFSYSSRQLKVKVNKTETTRPVPVHPALWRLLEWWRTVGWPLVYGREPGADDLIAPTRRGTPRHLTDSAEGRRRDLEVLGLRHRRGHDLRRTMISLAVADGARPEIVKLITHTPRTGSAFDLYISMPWETLCTEIAKLRISQTCAPELGTGLGTAVVDIRNQTGKTATPAGFEPASLP